MWFLNAVHEHRSRLRDSGIPNCFESGNLRPARMFERRAFHRISPIAFPPIRVLNEFTQIELSSSDLLFIWLFGAHTKWTTRINISQLSRKFQEIASSASLAERKLRECGTLMSSEVASHCDSNKPLWLSHSIEWLCQLVSGPNPESLAFRPGNL